MSVGDDLVIVAPSHGRAGMVTAFKCFGDELLLCVSEGQAPLYRDAYPDAKLDVHPDDIIGLGPKMTWMYEKYGSFFRVDDDAKQMRCHVDTTRVEPKVACDVIRRLADQTEQMGLYFFGVTGEVIPRHFLPQAPFTLTGMVEGGKSGFLAGGDFWWPKDVMFADDIWIAAQNAYVHRACLVDERYAIPTQDARPGGQAMFRTDDAIWEKSFWLQEQFGDAIVLKNRSDRIGTEVTQGSRAAPKIDSSGMAGMYPWRLKVPW